jgi:hypothetical protein
MTSALTRKLAAVAAVVVGIVFASTAVDANAATTSSHKITKVHVQHVAHTPTHGNTASDWWW